MKHHIRNLAISIISALGMSAAYRAYRRTRGPLVRVIAFHDVKNNVWFQEVIEMLIGHYHVISPEQFHAQEFDAQKINVLLTFDDGYQSWVDVCAPILKKNKLKALFFINSGLLDIAYDSSKVSLYMKERLLLTPKAPLTWDGSRTLLKEGHTIGGHSSNHYNLAVLDQSVLESEINGDKKRTEEQLGVTLTDFAYPFGRKKNYNPNVFGVVKQAGYTWQYSAMSCFDTSTQVIPRTLIEKNQSMQSLKQWIEGGYDILTFLK